jgi:ubiquinone/menaquinone biosynthesis C-methylase UbiE
MGAIYNKIGDGYDSTRKADPAIVKALAELLGVEHGGRYVDVACGTGNYTVELARNPGVSWWAFDQSEKMLSEARAKSAEIQWDLYDAASTGYQTGSFDGALCTLAVHHFESLGTVFSEVHRILDGQGNFVIFTALPDQMRSYWLCEYFPVMMEKACEQMPKQELLEASLRESGFVLQSLQPFWVTPDIQDLFLYSGKQRPEMYLSKRVRGGISSFRNLCNSSELASGLAQLETDIASGAIQSIMSKYRSDTGDYVFLAAKAK